MGRLPILDEPAREQLAPTPSGPEGAPAGGATEPGGRLDRRRFLQLSGASLALAGGAACTKQPPEEIVPYVEQPENVVPGEPLYYATAALHAGYAAGVLAESHLGRPTKLEGNPEHPASLGGSDLFTQASVLDLYDPDRSRAITHLGQIRTWAAFTAELAQSVEALSVLGGRGLRVLTGGVTSPTLEAQMAALLERLPEARWHRWEAAGRWAVYRGAELAFGEALEPRFDLSRAAVVVTLDSDLLTQGPGAVRYAKDFAARRRARHPRDAERGTARLYAIESAPTATGTLADHRLALRPSEVSRLALALAVRLGVVEGEVPTGLATGETGRWLDALAADLAAHRGAGLIVAGDAADPEVHALAHAMNAALGNVGATVELTRPVEADPVDPLVSLTELTGDMEAGTVDTLLVLGANPVYDAPVDLGFAAAMANVRLRIHLGQREDETAELCHWHVPEAHSLEGWGDARAFDGTATILQPIILPLYGGKTAGELVAALLGRTAAASQDLVREHWEQRGLGGATGFEPAWRRALHDGVVPGTRLESVAAGLDAAGLARAAAAIGGASSEGLELAFRPDPTVFDGRYANNAWLQECPKPLTKLTWDNALLMSPATAHDLGLGDLSAGDDQRQKAPKVRLTVGERSLELPVWVVPGHAAGALTLHLGYGRRRAGRVGDGAGFDAGSLRTSAAMWRVDRGVAVEPVAGHHLLASTQDHHAMEGRDLVRQGTLEGFRRHLAEGHGGEHATYPEIEHHGPSSRLSLMPAWPYDGYAWGMAVDLSACTGCSACVVACQAENNIPTVGKEQTLLGRELHWIRIDRYYGADGAPVLQQPVLCQHCEQAPCEVVCPVAATVHSDEGLNDMVYNRCVGTRYCSNNCPYKVRRFNFLLYADWETEPRKLQRNPDVTVRSRGVMEKCTYCVQRINQARIASKRQRRPIRDGEIQTACQQACPSDALVFGDVNDPESAVSRAKASPLNYSLLEALGTRPRTTYLARLRDPNPALERPAADGGEGGHA